MAALQRSRASFFREELFLALEILQRDIGPSAPLPLTPPLPAPLPPPPPLSPSTSHPSATTKAPPSMSTSISTRLNSSHPPAAAAEQAPPSLSHSPLSSPPPPSLPHSLSARRLRLLGSYAGAMGQCQFMPSSFLAYAVDHDGDGRRGEREEEGGGGVVG